MPLEGLALQFLSPGSGGVGVGVFLFLQGLLTSPMKGGSVEISRAKPQPWAVPGCPSCGPGRERCPRAGHTQRASEAQMRPAWRGPARPAAEGEGTPRARPPAPA